MTIMIAAFESSPDKGKGLARDMCVRWSLEEVGQIYGTQLLSFSALKQAAHRARNPFGQIPTYQDSEVTLFESGAIVFHIGERFGGLLPTEKSARARAISWMFAALNTIEPPIMDLSLAHILDYDQPWFELRLQRLDGQIRSRLSDLASHLGDRDWLDGEFSAADILMVTVLRRLLDTGIFEAFPNIASYVVRGEKRPAFQRAFDAQLAVYAASSQMLTTGELP